MTDDSVSDHDQAIIDETIEFAAVHVAPHTNRWERDRRFASEAFDQLGSASLGGLRVPVDLGGRGIGDVAFVRVLEELASVDQGVALSFVVHNNMARAVVDSGNATMIAEWLPSLVSGERIGSFLLTEPGIGSDATAITCSARRDGNDWVLDGEKAWAASGSHAGALNVFAQTDPALKHRGVVSILVDATAPGVTRTAPYELMGGHAAGAAGFEFDGVRVPIANTLAPVGEAFAEAMKGINLARIVVGAMCCGMLRRSLQVAVEYTKSRPLFGGTVSDKQGVRWMLADAATDLEAMRLLTYRAARLQADGADATLMASHAKKFASRKAEERIRDCMQVMGAAGYRTDGADNPLPRHLAAARMTGYIDGATEIQNVLIARSLWP